MAEGLEFLLELDAKLEGALGMVRALMQSDDALKKVDAGLRKVEGATAHASAGHAKLGREAEHTGSILNNLHRATLGPLIQRFEQIAEFEFIRRGVDALIEAPMEALKLFTELFEEMVKVSAEAERTEKSFSLLFGAGEGRETLEWIEGISKYTEFTGRELKGAAQDLARVGFKGEDLTRAMAAALDMSAFNKSGEAGMSEALSSLERIKRTGRVDNRSLGGLGVGEPEFLAELSRRTGEGVKTLKKKMDEGKIAAEDSLETLYSMIGKKTGKDLGGAGVEMSNTLQARLKHMQELPEIFFEKLRGTQGYGQLSDFVGKIVEAFDPDGDAGTQISEMLDKIFNGIGDKLNSIDLAATLQGIPAAVEAITSTINDLASAISPVVSAFETVAGIFAGDQTAHGKNAAAWEYDAPGQLLQQKLRQKLYLSKLMAKGGQTYQDPDVPFGPQLPGTERVATQYKAIGDHIRALKKTMGDAGSASGSSYGDTLTPSMGDAGKSGAAAAVAGTKDGLQQHSPSRVFENIGLMAGEGFNQGLDKQMSATDDVMRGAFAVPTSSAGARGTGPIHVETHITVHTAGGNADHIAAQVAEQVNEIIPGALQSAIERLSNQAGSS